MPSGCDACYICYMPDLNLRDLDVTLVTELKRTAALRRMTLRAHCIDLLSHPVVTITRPSEIVVDAPAVAKQPDPPKPVIPETVKPFLQQASTLTRPAHDSKSCKIYGCQLCSGLKKPAGSAKTEGPG